MAEQDHPCAGGLTPACFDAYPEWAKIAFTYKLLNAILPANITRRLPKGLFPGIIGPGAILPAGWIPPPGVIVPPNYTVPPSWIPFTYFILPPGETWEQVFPPGWTAGDPLPPGVTINTGAVFPAGWSAGDPLPAGVTVSPGAVFPAGWSAGDALPAGIDVNTAAIVPTGWSPTNAPPNWFAPGGTPGPAIPPGGVLPPLYLPPGLQSPPHTAQPRSPISAGPWFYDSFDTLDPNTWTNTSVSPGSAEVISGELVLTGTPAYEKGAVKHEWAESWPVPCYIELKSRISGAGEFLEIFGYTGLYDYRVSLRPSTELAWIYTSTGWESCEILGGMDVDIIWKLTIIGGIIRFYRDEVLILGPFAAALDATTPTSVTMEAWVSTSYIDYIKIDTAE